MLHIRNDDKSVDPTTSPRADVECLRAIIASKEQYRFWQLTQTIQTLTKWIRYYQRKYYKRQALNKSITIHQTPLARARQVILESQFSVPNVCGIAHVYYTDLADEIVEAFLRCGTLDSVVITTPTPTDDRLIDALQRLTKERPKLNIAVLTVENIGRDIYPFLQAVKHQHVLDCDVFLKIHTKKSLHLKQHQGRHWRQKLFNTLCPNSEQTIQIAASLHNLDNAWIAFPEEFAACSESWGKNMKNVKKLAELIGIRFTKKVVFAEGSMFWASCEIVKSLQFLSLANTEFNANQHQQDGEMPHAIERLFGEIVISADKKIWLF